MQGGDYRPRCWKILAALKRSRCFPRNGSQIYGALLSVAALPLLHLEILYSREKIEFIINPITKRDIAGA